MNIYYFTLTPIFILKVLHTKKVDHIASAWAEDKRMKRPRTDPITKGDPRKAANESLYIYRGPLFRTMSGYKFLSGSFILCGAITVPALLGVSDGAGITGAVAIGFASLLPITLQTILVPRYVARMALASALPETSGSVLDHNAQVKLSGGMIGRETTSKRSRRVRDGALKTLDDVSPETRIRVSYFTFLGPLRSRVEVLGDLQHRNGWRWVNWHSKSSGMNYYVEEQGAGPLVTKMLDITKARKETAPTTADIKS